MHVSENNAYAANEGGYLGKGEILCICVMLESDVRCYLNDDQYDAVHVDIR